MKKLLLLSILFLFTQIAITQTMRIRVDNYAYSFITNDVKESWSDWETTDLLILMNLDDKTIKIDNEFGDKFYLRVLVNGGNKEDEDGDIYKYFQYTCFDQNNVECGIIINSWNDFNLFHLYVYYSNVRYVYRGKLIE
jgi:hypothetical protein